MEKGACDNVFLSKIRGIFHVKNTVFNHWPSTFNNWKKTLAKTASPKGGFWADFQALHHLKSNRAKRREMVSFDRASRQKQSALYMAAFSLEKLLGLQERDSKRLALEQQLKGVPREVAAVEARIAAEKAAIESAKAEWHGLESKKKLLEVEIKSAEDKIAKYRTQQVQVRKNDEYQALTHEIDTTQTAIGTLEEQEIGVMLQIDEAKKRFAAAEAELKNNITGHEGRIRMLRERETQLQAEAKAAQEAVTATRPEVPEPQLRIYDRIAVKPGHPVCVPVNGDRCGGCHLKVPTHIVVQARNGAEIATCDQCGRVVYWAP